MGLCHHVVTPASLGYSAAVFNKKSIIKQKKRAKESLLFREALLREQRFRFILMCGCPMSCAVVDTNFKKENYKW